MAPGRVHDRAILDALQRMKSERIGTSAWRVTRDGRDPLRGAAAHGRWSVSGEFEVLYTSVVKEGAVAEIGYRLSLEPVWPSRLQHQVHELSVKADRILRLSNLKQLEKFDIDIARYKTFEYTQTQAVAAAAHFLEFDGLLVPSARYACMNLVIFTERVAAPDQLRLIRSEDVDWTEWRKRTRP